jgi:hypothetical protein
LILLSNTRGLTSPSVTGRLATILYVYELLHSRCIAPQQCENTSKFENRWIEYPLVGFPAQSSRASQEGFEVPRYFFHVKHGQVTVLDQEGIELANNAQAEEEAARRAQQCLEAWHGAPVGRGTSVNRGMIIVADENWRWLFALPF